MVGGGRTGPGEEWELSTGYSTTVSRVHNRFHNSIVPCVIPGDRQTYMNAGMSLSNVKRVSLLSEYHRSPLLGQSSCSTLTPVCLSDTEPRTVSPET